MTTSGAHVCRVDNFYDVGNTCLCQSGVEGFGRPLSDDGVWVFAHALFQTMIENKTKYLRNLESLQAAYSNCYGDCVGDIRMLKLSLLIAMFESGDMFEKLSNMLENSFIIDIDRDVNYLSWGNTATWYALKTKTARNSSPLSYETMCKEEKVSLANRLADMMPPEPETATDNIKNDKDLYNTETLTYSERTKFRETINNLNNENVFNTTFLDYAIDKAMKRLCNTLCNISKLIDKKKDNKDYESLYNNQVFAYNNIIGEAVKGKYTEWKNRFCEDNINEDSIKSHVEEALVELLKAGVFDEIEVNATSRRNPDFKKEIDFEDYDIPKKKKPYELYARFRGFYTFRNGMYTVDKAKVGRLLVKLRKDVDKLEAFFTFQQTLTHAYNDIKAMHKEKEVCSVFEDIDFSKLVCRFSEEKVKASGIKEHPDIVLAIIDHMRNEITHKSYWVTFFIVLLQKEWIEDNVGAFCNNMKSLFDVKLDRSAMNKKRNEDCMNIEEWPEVDKRTKEKKEFGLKFKTYIDKYLEYRYNLATYDFIY